MVERLEIHACRQAVVEILEVVLVSNINTCISIRISISTKTSLVQEIVVVVVVV